MMMLMKAAAAASLLSIAACDDPKPNNVVQVSNPPKEQTQVHQATGSIDKLAGLEATIAHSPVKALGWPAMTMTFSAGDRAMLEGLKVGDQVSFAFRKSGGSFVLTSISKR